VILSTFKSIITTSNAALIIRLYVARLIIWPQWILYNSNGIGQKAVVHFMYSNRTYNCNQNTLREQSFPFGTLHYGVPFLIKLHVYMFLKTSSNFIIFNWILENLTFWHKLYLWKNQLHFNAYLVIFMHIWIKQ